MNALAIDAAGRLYVAGRFDSYNGTPVFGLFRLNADGTRDQTWSPGFNVFERPFVNVRLQVSGRLGGADIARRESIRVGSVPLHTLRANVDYGTCEARTVYGAIGIKCWLCLPPEEKVLSF